MFQHMQDSEENRKKLAMKETITAAVTQAHLDQARREHDPQRCAVTSMLIEKFGFPAIDALAQEIGEWDDFA
jgi:hypothetical protein